VKVKELKHARKVSDGEVAKHSEKIQEHEKYIMILETDKKTLQSTVDEKGKLIEELETKLAGCAETLKSNT